MSTRGRRGRGRGLSYNRLSQRIAGEKFANKGGKLRTPFDPPALTQIPWWPITLCDHTDTGTTGIKNYTAVDISRMLNNQTNLPYKNDADTPAAIKYSMLSLRMLSVQCWGNSGVKTIGLEVFDFTIGFGADDLIYQVEDNASISRNARVGYQIPRSQSLVIFSGHDTETLFKVTSKLQNDKIVVYLRILWKVRSSSLPAVNRADLMLRIQHLEQQVRSVQLS